MTDPEYLRYQYGDSEKLRIRIEAHERYSEVVYDHHAWIVGLLDVRPGVVVVDAGCGPGRALAPLVAAGARPIGFDRSLGMVHEARRAALDGGHPPRVFQADARAIPLPDAACDRLLAAHMLFHVPEPAVALREFRRVLRPGGRVAITTNAADHAARIHEMHDAAARELGYAPSARTARTRFNLDHLDLVRAAFPAAERVVVPNAFVFPTADAALAWYATAAIDNLDDRPADGSHRPKLLRRMEERIADVVRREGVFRVPKDAGAFVAVA